MDIFNIAVQTGDKVVEVGECDVDHISLITLIHAICQKLSGNCDVPTVDYHVWAQISWCGEKYGVCSDSELLELFSRFEECGLYRIVFELKDYCYVPTPPEEPPVLDVEGGYDPIGWCEMEAEQLNYEGDSEQDDENDDEGGSEEECPQNEVPIIDEESVEVDNDITQECMDFFERYQSKISDEYFTDSELEPDQVRIAKLVKGQPFKIMFDGVISFHIGQIFNSKEHMREIFKEVYHNKEAKVKWIASKFEKLVKSNPSINVRVIGDLLKETYKVSVDIRTLYRAKNRALKELAKDHGKCFGYLRRPFIGVDGCHLKRPFGEVLLSVVSLDANSGLFSLVVCICEKETQDSWEWFLNNMKIYLNYPEGRKLTFMSDRQMGVIAALEVHFPYAHRRYAYDPVIRCDHATNNMTKAFNSMLSTHRAASYLDLLEFIRRMVMRKFNDRKEECSRWSSVLPPRVHVKILKHSRESRTLTMIAAGNMEYELIGASRGYAVKLREFNCECGSWQVSGIPYCHAMAAKMCWLG
ncbi:hypothetical protein Ddye_029399 [Dipteronia dyeriana]|uniref:MULE transposase domain-containing protein n=1 Tax=Dipteronia dyeriana TaxID=168575 RepID=A0AAD9WLF7_9ROSI|nr:hypothetical protein Ddye_029399 [Dipteronia dyeriana]